MRNRAGLSGGINMCGHGMVSHNLARTMIDWVKDGRRTPEQAASYLTRFCSCGVFNPPACSTNKPADVRSAHKQTNKL